VIIISRGKLVATDSVANLTNRLRGSEAVNVEVIAGGVPDSTVKQLFEQVPGVSRVSFKSSNEGRHVFEVESLQGHNVRGDIARAVVQSGWSLNELRPLGFSLEDIFLQLTASEKSKSATASPEEINQ
jgi:ABC-2 type transport system ATP-binding protein